MGGDPTFAALSRKLAFGADCPAVGAGRIATVQSLSGTGEQEGCETCVQACLSNIMLSEGCAASAAPRLLQTVFM